MEQLNLFEQVKPKYKINKPVRLIELFAGIGSQAKALERLGVDFEHYKVVEFDEHAIKSYNAIHGTNFASQDITQTHAKDLEIIDKDRYCYLMTYSFPCFVEDTLVLTNSGYKKISELSTDDSVLTHTNTYQKVLAVKNTGEKETSIIKGMGIDEIQCTPNHKFYVRKMTRHYPTLPNGKRHTIREFGKPEWIECKDLTKKHYLGVAINQNSIIPTWNGIDYVWTDGRSTRHKNTLQEYMCNTDFWWLVGRYVGDGWHRSQGGIIICCNHSELSEITNVVDRLNFNYNVVDERTVYKIHFASKELEAFVEPFGRGAANKCIPGFVFDLPINLIDGFLQGYISADGNYVRDEKLYRTSSVSRELTYGIAQLVAKAYKTPYKIYKITRPKQCQIEGRTVNQKDTYNLYWKLDKRKQDKAFYEDGYIWFPIRSIKNGNIESVYDIETDIDHSFTANGVIVHNCQDLSLAGKGRGMKKGSGTRSGLLWEVERILDECKGELPQILLMENVPQVLAEKNINDFHSWQRKLEQLGYSNYVELLNAKDYGIPQNRNRCFMVSILGDYYYSFPQKQELKLKLKDMLEKDVDEKYYLSDKMINCFMSDGTGNYPRRERFLQNINRKNQDISNAITTCAGSRPTDNFVIPKTLMETLETSDIPDGVNMIDAYNRNIRDDELSGTITARIDDSNHYIAIKNAIS